jgi:hypothetical protein
MKVKLGTALTALVIAYLVVLSSAAMAAGGSSIAAAPTVAYGQQEFGNTATDGAPPTGANQPYAGAGGWWALPVIAGDALTIDWEGQDGAFLSIYSVGTTDFNVRDRDAVVSDDIDTFFQGSPAPAGKSEVHLTAQQSGTMPMNITNYAYGGKSPGPYNFIAYVKHAVILALPHVSSLGRAGTLNVQVHNPDGGPITDAGLRVAVEVRIRSHHATIGVASASSGVARVSYKIPRLYRHSRVSIRAVATGPDYRTKHSSSLRVTTR